MGKTSIEWTDASWNPIVGCTEISPGCANCYAARLAASRLTHTPQYKNLATIDGTGVKFPRNVRWTGEVRFLPERLEEPLHWRKPRRIFVCDMGDLFHESVEDDWLESIFVTMLNCKRHTFQILTKRPQRMFEYFKKRWWLPVSERWADPMPNVWLGVSVENQHFADERIPLLLQTPAAVRWISCEPLLGSLDISKYLRCRKGQEITPGGCVSIIPDLDWVVCGGESGPSARPMHPDWARLLRDQCQAAGVPFFFKQWGEFGPPQKELNHLTAALPRTFTGVNIGGGELMLRYGKKLSGRLIDGREWNEFPQVNR